MRYMFLRGGALATTVLAAALATSGVAQAADSLTITSWGGAYQEAQRKAFFEPYAKETGTKITEEEYNGEIAKLRAMVESNSVTWDVVDVDTQTAIAACAEGILEEIPWEEMGLDRSKFIGSDTTDCAIPDIAYSTIIAYDADKLEEGPTTIADLFDLEKFPGKRALQKNPFVNLEWALIADGVPIDKLYEVLETDEGIERAFAKLDTIKDEVIWWEAGAQPPQLLADGQVVMASAWNGRIYNAATKEGKNFKIVWDHQALDFDWWAMPKGGPRRDAAVKFISWASQPKTMATLTEFISYGPPNKDATPHVTAEILPHLPTAPDNMKTAIVVDNNFWADRGEELRERFNAWLAQ